MATTEKPARGPGKKPSAQKRTSSLEFRVSPAERRVIEGHAEYHGLGLSEYLRQRAVGVELSLGPRPQRVPPEAPHQAPPLATAPGGVPLEEMIRRVKRERPDLSSLAVRREAGKRLRDG